MTIELDPGLQAERTAMAWQRTALGLGGVSALLVRHAGGDPLAAVPGALGLLAAVALLVVVETRFLRTHRHVAAGTEAIGPRLVRALGWGTALLAVGVLGVVVAALFDE